MATIEERIQARFHMNGKPHGDVIYQITPEPWRILESIIATVLLIAYMILLNMERDEKEEDDV